MLFALEKGFEMRSRKTLIILAASLLLLTGSASAWYATKSDDKKQEQAESTQDAHTDEQFPGPTDQEKEDANQHKDDVVKQQEVESNPQSGQKAVTPVITNALQNDQEIFAGSYVPGVFEEGGTCTYTFTKGSLSLVKTNKGTPNVSTTNCENVRIPRSEFSEPGSWALVVSYSSPKAKGSSESKTLTVQ